MSNGELVKLYQEGNRQAIDELLKNNQGIIRNIASKYMRVNSRLEFDDLFNSGVIGLINAAKNYDFNNDKKAKFITYAVHYINRQIYICVNGRSEKDIANTKFYNECKSLNAPISNDGETEEELGDFIEGKDYGFENIIEQEFHKHVRSELDQVMNEHLTLNEREVIKFLYGWECDVMSMQEVGEILNITRERVRQLKDNALRKIRHTSWWITRGKFYALEIKGLVYTKISGRTLSYREVEKDDYSIETIQGHNFINKYFDDLMGA